MQQEIMGDTMQFSQIVSLEDTNEHMIKSKRPEQSSKSIMIDVLLMLLCERSNTNQVVDNIDTGLD